MSVSNLIKEFDLNVIDIQKLKTHGGSLRYFISHKNSKYKVKNIVNEYLLKEKKYKLNKISTYVKFGLKVKESKIATRKLLLSIKKKGKKIS